MKAIVSILLVILAYPSFAQDNHQVIERKGFIFGTSTGMSFLNLTIAGLPSQNVVSASIPNFKIGSMISNNMAILLHMPGSIYKYNRMGRKRDRGFEGIIPSLQYWNNHKIWLLAGVGISMDAPAFYDIKSDDEREFYFGYGLVGAAGYELWNKGRFVIDVQTRIHYGEVNFDNLNEKGFAANLLLGFNWY